MNIQLLSLFQGESQALVEVRVAEHVVALLRAQRGGLRGDGGGFHR